MQFFKQVFGSCIRMPYRVLSQCGFFNWIPDSIYLRVLFRVRVGKKLNLKNPQTFNEKLQWLKLYNRKPEYTTMVDKYAVKQWVTERIGGEYVVPTIGVWDFFDEINFDILPNQFVLKCTHDSGGLVICQDKNKLDRELVRARIERSLKKNYYYHSREWPYKNVKPRIIAEKYLQDGNTKRLPVYKVFNFMGNPRIIQVIQNDKTAEESVDYFDFEWNRLVLQQNYPNSEWCPPRPQQLKEMLELARKLSQSIPFVRTDFYEVNGTLYFSEITFYSDGGMAKFHPEEWDRRFGDWIDLS